MTLATRDVDVSDSSTPMPPPEVTVAEPVAPAKVGPMPSAAQLSKMR